MKFHILLDKIDTEVLSYRDFADAIGKAFAAAKQNTAQKAQEMRDSGNYTEKYISEWERSQNTGDKFLEKLSEPRENAKAKIDYYANEIEKAVNDFILAPVRSDFANKIAIIQNSGMRLSDAELKTLWDDSRSYLERRAVQALAEGRTKTELRIVRENGSEEPRYERETVSDPYVIQDYSVIDTDGITKSIDYLRQSANGLIDYYAGVGGELLPLFDYEQSILSGGVGVAYLNGDAMNECRKALETAESITDDGRKGAPLTTIERRLIDATIDPKYQILARQKAIEKAKTDFELRPLLLRDDRYRTAILEDEAKTKK